jgi:hypothetical protein
VTVLLVTLPVTVALKSLAELQASEACATEILPVETWYPARAMNATIAVMARDEVIFFIIVL